MTLKEIVSEVAKEVLLVNEKRMYVGVEAVIQCDLNLIYSNMAQMGSLSQEERNYPRSINAIY